MLQRLNITDTVLIHETSKFLLGPARAKFLAYYTEEELQGLYDSLCSVEAIGESVSSNACVYIISQGFSQRVNGVVFGKKIQEQNAQIITNIVVGEEKRGIGTVLVQRYEGEFPNVDFFVAQIREANIPSQRLFESQGYIHDGYAGAMKNIRMYYKDRV